ncbi:Vitamin B6 transporter [Sporothrix eucalyptigena]|uniref:Vitamin B6 transporter n=1 Tax=Sporothrix eucalyptigena TaxID=1812306 RepID=A0ABP0D151_9PEZI
MDEEKTAEPVTQPAFSEEQPASVEDLPESTFAKWCRRLDNIPGLEVRGIERVEEDQRQPLATTAAYFQMFIVWFSINCTANNMTLGILGPVLFGLGFKDAVLCCLFGTIFGSACTGYMAGFGPRSGLRTLIVARYSMGYWPSKLCVLLNIVIEVGYGVVDCLVAGLILNAVSGYKMTVVVGIVVSALIAWIIATFGIKWFHAFERYVWIPTVLVLFILIGSAGPNFDTSTPSSGSGAVLAGNRLSYFFLTASGPLGWAPAAADFYSYFHPKTPRIATATMTGAGITMGKLLIEFLGIGLASGLASTPAWSAAFDHSTGALITAAFDPLGSQFGHFCAVVLALCVSANNIPGTYAAALNFQMLGRPLARVPRPIWATIVVVIYTVCAIAGRAQLLSIFLNFLSLIGYWVIIWVAIVLEDEFIFRRRTGFDWARSTDRSYLPVGLAAFVSFLVGWAGAIPSMYQTYYTGPIAKLVGNGADLGLPVAMSWTSLVYPPLRVLELKFIGR